MALKLRTTFTDNVTTGLKKKLEGIKDLLLPKSDAERIGEEIVKEMKSMISRGVSPIRGNGRFPAYKNGKDGYPSNVNKETYPNKRRTPVNLFLSGDQMDDLKSWVIRAGIQIGYTHKQAINKERGHREGTNGQPQRPTIPVASQNEEFAVKIQNVYLKAIEKNLKKL